MGLCKCPKRKVTNQFCFEHRVNVCEHCMVNSHKKCVVQSYLAWLKDSDFSPDCGFCNSPLSEDECVRLTCYCLYHWTCLDNHCRNLPPNTAPAGYTCLQCDAAIFPPENLVSPVADQLRNLLQGVNWARAGLGLPLLADGAERKPRSVPVGPRPTPEGEDKAGEETTLAQELAVGKKAVRTGSTSSGGQDWKAGNDTILNFDTPTSRRTGPDHADPATAPLIVGDPDSDANKYKRRGPTDFLFRWLRTVLKPGPVRRRRCGGGSMLAFVIVITLLMLAAAFSYLGRSEYNDPMLDPLLNPNIRVRDN